MSGDDIADLSLLAAREALASGALTAEEVTEAALARAERFAGYNLFITATPRRARKAAAAADRERASGRPLGPLHGVPVTVKDNIDMAGLPTTAGSKLFAERVASTDARVVTRLAEAGAIVLGKVNLHELAFGSTTINPFYGAVPNPWQPDHVPGGSSGGSAASVSLGVGYASLGTDAAGSVRMPASCCGLVGLKPTHGLVSQHGMLPSSAEHVDHIGPLARSVADARAMFEVLLGPDPENPHSAGHPASAGEPLADLAGLRVGVPRGWFWEELDPAVESAGRRMLELMAGAGATVVSVPMDISHLVPLLRTALFAEAYVFHAPTLAAHPELYSPELRHRLLAGQYVLAQDYIRVLRVRRLVIEAIRAALSEVDVLAMPTMPITPPRIEAATSADTATMPRNTLVINQSGHPALSLPMGLTTEGIPMGFQLVGRVYQDRQLLGVAEVLERLVGFDPTPPPLRPASA